MDNEREGSRPSEPKMFVTTKVLSADQVDRVVGRSGTIKGSERSPCLEASK